MLYKDFLAAAEKVIGERATQRVFSYATNDVLEKEIPGKFLIISDCDGILTDSSSYYDAGGKAFKKYGAYDKEAMKLALAAGIEFQFVTKDANGASITFSRLRDFCGEPIALGSGREASMSERIDLIKKYKKAGYRVFYCGDSLSDISVGAVSDGFLTVSNAPNVVQKSADFTAKNKGGYGGFADCIFKVLDSMLQDLIISY